MNTRFAVAMTAYAALAALATVLMDGKMRAAVWLFLGLLAVKTLIVVGSRRGE